MRLSDDEVMITLGSQAFTLKASLRAAHSLNLKYKGYHNLAEAISQGTFSAYLDVVTAGCTDPAALNAFLKPFHDPDAFMTPLGNSILSARDELLEFILVLTGARYKADEPSQRGEPITFEQFHETLFELGAGFLGWSPEDTWEASPSEIMVAAGGRKKLLALIFGGKPDDDTIERSDDGKLEESARAELNALGDLNVTTMPRAR